MADYLGITAEAYRKPDADIVAEIARLKKMPLESFKAFGAASAKRGKLTVARVPMYGPDREKCSSFDMATIDEKFLKGMAEKGKPTGLFITKWPEPGDTVLITEGPKDAAALHGLGFLVVAMLGTNVAAKFARVFARCHVIVVPDRDAPGEKGAKLTASRLSGVAASVKIVTLPGELKESGGDGVREVRDRKDGETILRQAIADAVEWQPRTEDIVPDDRVETVVTTDEADVNEFVIRALAKDESLFQRGGKLVHVVSGANHDSIDRPEDAPRVSSISLAGLRERLTRVARFVTVCKSEDGEDETKPAHPPKWCYEAIAARGEWSGIRSLVGVVTAPVLRPDGSVLNAAGYDPQTGLLFDPQGVSFPIIERPSHGDAIRAAASLLELVADFPFSKSDHRAAWLAFLLTPSARFAFAGPAPLFLVDANVRGSGKSLLCDVVSLIVAGREMSRMTNPNNDDEARKRITALALAGDALVLIDNVIGGLGCASLDAALTATVWKDRVLGASEIVELPLLVTWSATGNNVVSHADTSRRVAHIRLDSRLENPEQRDGFKHPNLKAFVRQHRPKLLADVLTILAAYCQAGRPRQQLPTWGSFEGWSDLVRQAVVWCGQSDPGATRTELVEQSDREAIALRELLAGWDELDPDCSGLTTTEILTRLAHIEYDQEGKAVFPQRYKHEQVRNAVLELCPPRPVVPRLPITRPVATRHRRRTQSARSHHTARQAVEPSPSRPRAPTSRDCLTHSDQSPTARNARWPASTKGAIATSPASTITPGSMSAAALARVTSRRLNASRPSGRSKRRSGAKVVLIHAKRLCRVKAARPLSRILPTTKPSWRPAVPASGTSAARSK